MKVNSDLLAERRKAAVSSNVLTPLLYGPKLMKVFEQLKPLLDDPLVDTQDVWVMNNQQRYLRACERAERLVRLIRKYGWADKPEILRGVQIFQGDDFFLNLHFVMFVPTIEALAGDDQRQKWLPLAKDFRIIGTYSQTELGHGSNVAGLETTADLDLQTDEWVLNTPTLESTKWWPGGLGKSCTHCILMARLRIKGNDYGVHPFMLQVRDLENHKTLPGIMLMHIGQKLGYNGMDNGGMQLKGARIPRTSLLMRFYSVDKQGNYSVRGNLKLIYGTMTFTRQAIIAAGSMHLARAVVIATRYSAVRRQFSMSIATQPAGTVITNRPQEVQILDYTSQQYLLFPLLASTIGFMFAGHMVHRKYEQFQREAAEGNIKRLEEVHAITSSLKASITMVVVEGIECCRRICGGHGYLLSAGLPIHLANYLPQITYEGDFVVLSIQAGRSLMKAVQLRENGVTPYDLEKSSTRYVYEFDPSVELKAPEDDAIDLNNPEFQLKAFQQRSNVLIQKTFMKLAAAMGENDNNLVISMDTVKVEFTRLAHAHSHACVLKAFHDRLRQVQKENAAAYKIMKDLCDIYAIYWMHESFGEFVATKVLAPDHDDILMSTLKNLFKSIRPQAIAITDAFNFSDDFLNSVLGRYDGRIYEAIVDAASREPLNDKDVTDGYYRSIQYILHPERKATSSKL
uniref:Acyl-coenzyme A oxidase n=1 Tax=Nephromyces sp. MMRI TaxID=2496275 RepID=A0A3Q8UBV2_9APIC|nr:acyl-CoA oxidase [Nephromyces sp. MMRI]AZL94508.1 acyl-CoA oxidase [Nephromyces sp. MMRI]AZL94509.1 acyl-CoA oxidase [Nephromyces sp. MMRI]AZL94510.1 acyl-CoA oxidase [Nephromyces sp. MMRI]AZL94511.1 acyl-CoA oxidase [Nephromyces sp. MMRI]